MSRHVFSAAYIDDQIFGANGLAHYLTGVHFVARADNKRAALLQVFQSISAGRARLVRDQRAVLLYFNRTRHRLVALEERVKGARAARRV